MAYLYSGAGEKAAPVPAAVKPTEDKKENLPEHKTASEINSEKVNARLRQMCEEHGIEW